MATCRSLPEKVRSPSALPTLVLGGLKSSSRSRGLSPYAARTRSIIPAGPHAQVSVSRKRGTSRRSSSSLNLASPWRRCTVTSLSSAAILASSPA